MEEGEIVISKDEVSSLKSSTVAGEKILDIQEKGTEDEKVSESEKDTTEQASEEIRNDEEGAEFQKTVKVSDSTGEDGGEEIEDEDLQDKGRELREDNGEINSEKRGIEDEEGEIIDEEGEIQDEDCEIKHSGGEIQNECEELFNKDADEKPKDDDGEIMDEDEGEVEDEPQGISSSQQPENDDFNVQSEKNIDTSSLPTNQKRDVASENEDKSAFAKQIFPAENRGELADLQQAECDELNTTEPEEGELDESDDKEAENFVDAENKPAESGSAEYLAKATERDEISDVKNGVARMEFGMDETRPEDEQLDYDEDELEEKMKGAPELTRPAERTMEVKSDGEVDSASDGEIKSDDGDGEDFEEGETRDHPLDLPPEQKKICKFFEMGNCTWGDRCRYLHPGVNDKGNYNMFSEPQRRRRPPPPPFHPEPPHGPPVEPFWGEPPPFLPPPPPVAETAWEKGLRHAKELKKRALQRKVQEPDFMQKREILSLNFALNEDHDMEFVNHNPSAANNKGFDPFDEDDGEYAIPTPEEVRRQLSRGHRRGPPPAHRLTHDKDRRPPPPEHMMPPEIRRDRRPPSPRHHQGANRYPPDMRRMSPGRDVDRERRPNLPPVGPGLIQRQSDRRDRRDYTNRSDDRGHYPQDQSRREFPPERERDEKYPDGGKGLKRMQNGASLNHGQQWNDPWARGRPQGKGRNAKNASSSSSGSSSASSSRSSSRSSGTSHSSFSGSSRSSSRSTGSSRSSSFSSDRDSSRSPSPSKNLKPKKKVLSSTKQRNATAGVQKKPPPAALPVKIPAAKPTPPLKTEPAPGAVAKSLPVPSKKPPDKKPVLPTSTSNITKQPVAKKPKKQASSSSSEFSHSSDSSPSPSRAKAKSGSESGSGSSSSSSSFSSSSGSSSSDSDEGDKPTNRRKGKGASKSSIGSKGQIPPSATVKPAPLQQQNKGKVMVPSKPGRKDVKMTIIDKPGVPKKRTATEMTGQQKKPSSRRTELLEQLKAVEDAIARKRAKLT